MQGQGLCAARDYAVRGHHRLLLRHGAASRAELGAAQDVQADGDEASEDAGQGVDQAEDAAGEEGKWAFARVACVVDLERRRDGVRCGEC